MIHYATLADRDRFEKEMPWDERERPATTWAMLSRTAARHGSRPAVTFQMFSGPTDKAETLTWKELSDRTAQVANLFRSLGIGETDVVAFVLPNCAETVLTYLGGQIAGIVNPINPLLDPAQIGAILRETRAKAVVTLKAFPKTDVAQKVAAAVAGAPDVRTVIEVDFLHYLTGAKRLIAPLLRPASRVSHHAEVIDFESAVEAQPTALAFDDSAGDRVAAYFHTGGTTGMPKVAQHRYDGIIYNAWLVAKMLFTERDVQICPLPMFHVFAAIVSFGGSLGSGAHIVLPTPQGYRGAGVFDNFWKLIERYKVNFMITVPTAIAALMQRPVDADISSLKLAFSGSAPLPVEIYKRFEKAAEITICEGYGLTEATCLVSINPPNGEKRIGSIGFPVPYTDVKIVKGTPSGPIGCKVDEIGEICVASPGVVPDGTYTQDSKNAGLYYYDRYLRTGDLGRVDPDGYIWITGRAKDLIIRGGHNIDPAIIEEALAGHRAVAFAAAIGQPDAFAGELPCAYIELVAGASASEAELMEYAAKHVIERAAVPKHLEILPELPKTAVGKVFKPDLRKRAIARVYNAALSDACIESQVVEVIEDAKRGLVAVLDGKGEADTVAKALGGFTRPYDLAPPDRKAR